MSFTTRVHDNCTLGNFLLEMSRGARNLLDENSIGTDISTCVTKREIPTEYISKIPANPEDVAESMKNVNQMLKETLKIDGELDAPCKSSMKCKESAKDLINNVMFLMKSRSLPLDVTSTSRIKILLGNSLNRFLKCINVNNFHMIL